LKKLIVAGGRSWNTIEWERIRGYLTAKGPVLVLEDAVARQLAVLQATAACASIRLDELRTEWLDTKFFLSNAAETEQSWFCISDSCMTGKHVESDISEWCLVSLQT